MIPDKKKIAFPHLAPGYYVVEMLIDGKPGSSTVNYTVSGIKTIVRSAGEKSVELLAVDAQTGKPKYPLRQTVIHLLQTYLTQAIGIDTTKRKRPLFSPIARSIVRDRPSISREYDTSIIRKKVA